VCVQLRPVGRAEHERIRSRRDVEGIAVLAQGVDGAAGNGDAAARLAGLGIARLNRPGFARGSAHCLTAADAAGLAFAEVEGPGSTLLV
jgi:hypothetical protein